MRCLLASCLAWLWIKLDDFFYFIHLPDFIADPILGAMDSPIAKLCGKCTECEEGEE